MMKKVLVLGAGKSSAHLIKYLSEHSERLQIFLHIVDIRVDAIREYLNHPRVKVRQISEHESNPFESFIIQNDIVISMLPAFMHGSIAGFCLKYSKHLITPSYVSDEMKRMDAEAKSKNLIFLNELGFDPGIDHMTTMKIYHDIQAKGGKLISYRSYAGGLVAPGSDTNPWNYKFSWNPRNVVLAGQGGYAHFRRDGEEVSYSYDQLFARSERIEFRGEKVYDAYANRDSLKYETLYQWGTILTLLRGTIRGEGFCEGWNYILKLGMTDNEVILDLNPQTTYYQFYQLFHKVDFRNLSQDQICKALGIYENENLIKKLEYIGFWEMETQLKKCQGTAAEILQSILEDKWKLEKGDRDLVIMIHYFIFEIGTERYELTSSLSLEGEDDHYTAMSKTVGLPIALACEMIVEGGISEFGVSIPTSPSIYTSLLLKLEKEGIVFKEEVKRIDILPDAC